MVAPAREYKSTLAAATAEESAVATNNGPNFEEHRDLITLTAEIDLTVHYALISKIDTTHTAVVVFN